MPDRFHAPKEISTNATTTISGNPAALLHSITINDPGSSWVLAVYSDTSQTTRIANVKPSAPVTLWFDATCPSGISVVTSGTTPGSATVNYS